MIELFDTHCHIHEIDGDDELAAKWHKNHVTDSAAVLAQARESGVSGLMLVGCTEQDSQLAVTFAAQHDETFASIGIHPHEAAPTLHDSEAMKRFTQLAGQDGVSAIGECGLDFYYNHSPRAEQFEILRFQLQLAKQHVLPVIFHVRDAFDEFWPVFDEFPGLRGVIHSFTATTDVLEQVLQRDLYVGLNGIMTFTKDDEQLAAAKKVPLDRLLLETDAPFLTPKPFRGKVNMPAYVRETAAFLAEARGEPLEELCAATTANARKLFNC